MRSEESKNPSSQTRNVGDEPSESAVDIVEALKTKSAHQVFRLNIFRIRELLKAGSAGIDKSKVSIANLITKVKSAEKIADDVSPVEQAGDETKSKRPIANLIAKVESAAKTTKEVSQVDGPGDDLVVITFDELEMELIQKALAYNSGVIGELHFHLHNVLCVAAWGAFEGYIQSALAELFAANPDLLASDKKMSVTEIIGAGENLIDYLVAKEIDDLGRKSFDDLQGYLRSKLKIQFSSKHASLMRDAYFLRNVIAHSAGFLRKEQLSSVPPEVNVKDTELRIGHEYLHSIVACIEDAVRQFDDRLRSKFGPKRFISSDTNLRLP